MWRNKKLIIIEVLVVVMLGAMLGGIAVVRANDENTNQDQNNTNSLMGKVAAIYQANTGTAIDPQELEKAFEQAGQEIRNEARDQFLQKLVDEGKITQDQADQWKAWLDARPDIPELGNGGGMMTFGSMHRGGGFGFRMGNCLPGSDTTK